jgi:excisionase family DNA binding protein
MDDKKPEILTVEQAADYLGVSRVTVNKMLKAGKLPGAKIGRAWRIRRADLDKVLAGQYRQA